MNNRRLHPIGKPDSARPLLVRRQQNLVFMTDNGRTNITQDELGNTYDRVGGPYSNYKP